MFERGDKVWFSGNVMSDDFNLHYNGEEHVREYYRNGMPEGLPTVTKVSPSRIQLHLPNHSDRFTVKREEIGEAVNSIEKIER